MTESYKDTLRDKIFGMADFVGMSYYVNNPNMTVGKRPANDVVLYSLMTGLLNRNQLITGNYGLGKTTTAQAVSSLLYGLPIEFVHSGMVKGHAQLTEEKLFGRLDFSELSEHEKVIFSIFAQTPSAKIIDEINRIPAGTQNILLDAVETGVFSYLNESLELPKMPFFATANYTDRGNTQLTPPLMDRFDVSVEVAFPLFLQSYIRGDFDESRLSRERAAKLKKLRSDYSTELGNLISSGADDETLAKSKVTFDQNLMNIMDVPTIDAYKGLLSDKTIASEMEGVICDKDSAYSSKLEKIASLSGSFSERLGELSMTPSERKSLPYMLHVQGFEPDARLLLDVFFDHLNSELKINGEESGHNKEYALGRVTNNPSVRTGVGSSAQYAKCLSFLKEEDTVSAETVQEMLPYAINHRLTFSDKFRAESDDIRQSSMQMGLARQLVTDFVEDDFAKNKEEYRKMYQAVQNGTADKFLEAHKDSDNPLFKRLYQLRKR
ncbi:AAA family ATPase [Candidatus Woesearchaeota archaeon]|nr:AAA family ATPase [Candidatus Woesearchaeota archaeon]